MPSEIPARPLLTVKQLIPPARPDAVRRERLQRQLRLAETRLTVVVAPAGWGKTSLLSGWAADPGEERRIAWLSLDESDDEPARFWSYVLTALRDASDEISDEPLTALGAADLPVVEFALPILLNELAGSATRHVLVLDDYHVIEDSRIHEAVEFLITYLPAALRLVIAGRADPPLPIARLRARGDLTEVRALQLRFSPDEAMSLVSTVSGRHLDEATAEAMWKRTEGWAAGLQLAAIALRADPAKIAADDRHLLDYFAAEVLPGLAPSQRDLLVRAAPLDRLSGPLCDAALDVTGSAEVLADLVRADLFVAALDGEQQWYRCHQLLRDALAREATTDPRAVLGRAADWFLAQDRIDDAVRHLLRAGRHEDAAAVLEEHAEKWFFPRGAASTFLQLGERLPSSAVGPGLAFLLANAAALGDDPVRVNRWLDAAVAGSDPGTAVPGWHSFPAAVLCWRAAFGVPDTEAARAVAMARQALDLETADSPVGHTTVRSVLGGTLARDGRFAEAADVLLDQWTRRGPEQWPPWIVLNVGGTLALALAESGRGEECDRVARDCGELAGTVERDQREVSPPGLAALRITEGRRRYQNGDEAAADLRRAVALADLHPPSTLLVIGLLYLADAELSQGDRAAARTALERAREVVETEPVSAFLTPRLVEAETRIGRGAGRAAVRSGALYEELTDRELSILRAMQGNASQREIGAALFLSINTVKAYSKRLYRKLGVASRQEAVAAARALGLI